MTFAQALARIEGLLKETASAKSYYAHSEMICEMLNLMEIYADSIVLLGKVAAEMRERCQIYQLDMGGNHTYHTNSVSVNEFVRAYDKLLNGEEG